MNNFNWRAKLCWIGRTDSGIVRQRLYDRGIYGLGLSLLDPGANTWAKAISTEAAFPFFYSDPHWHGLAGDGSALKYRQLLDSQLAALDDTGSMLMIDLELVSQEYVKRLLFGAPGNRGLIGSNNPANPVGTQQNRPLAYTNMGFQGNTVPSRMLIDADVHMYPQTYYGDMAPADVGAIVLEAVRWAEAFGSPRAADFIHPFYDGARIASDQRDGAWFTAERIPGVFSLNTMSAGAFAASTQARGSVKTKDDLRAHYTQLAEAA